MKIYNVPFNYSEIEVIQTMLQLETAKTPNSIANYTIIAPSELAANLCSASFTNKSTLSLLPNIISIADSKRLLLESLKLAPAEFNREIVKLLNTKAISENKRAFLLAKLLKAKNKNLHINEAINLAFELATLIDNLNTEKISLSAFYSDTLNFSYANELFQFIELTSHHWQEILQELQLSNIFAYKSSVLRLYAKSIAHSSVIAQKPIIVFGVNGYFKAMLEFLNAVVKSPTGVLVFSGIDYNLTEEEWNTLPETHPQYQTAEILKRSNLTRNNIENLNPTNVTQKSSLQRTNLLQKTFNYQPYTGFTKQELEIACNKFSSVDLSSNNSAKQPLVLLATDNDEAKLVALLVRKRLAENSQLNIAIVTTDLDLSKRIIFELGKWNISVGNSYGTELNRSSNAIFFNLLASLNFENLNNINLLAILKHPLCKLHSNYNYAFNTATLLDLHLLRGQSTNHNLLSLYNLNDLLYNKQKISENNYLSIKGLLFALNEAYFEVNKLTSQKYINFQDLLISHIKLAEQLSYCEDTNNYKIWDNPAGKILFNTLNTILEDAGSIGKVTLAEYQAILNNLFTKTTIQSNSEQGVMIYGILQAKFINSDLVIISDLNENSFPIIPNLSIWHSNYVTGQLNLPSKVETIGESAYIFSKLCAGSEVILTRSLKKQGNITTPSRFLTKLHNTLKANNFNLNNSELCELLTISENINVVKSNTAFVVPAKSPDPIPQYRPNHISVTSVEKLLKNPYLFFIENILALNPLDSLLPTADKRLYGNIVHYMLDDFFKTYNNQKLENINETDITSSLTSISAKYLAPHLKNYEIAVFWTKRLSYLTKLLASLLSSYLKDCRSIQTETKGEIELIFDDKFITLTGYPDLIVNHNDGTFNIIDYKTGSSKKYTKKSITTYHKQLILLGHLAKNHKFNNKSSIINSLEYWFFPEQTSNPINAVTITELLKIDDINTFIQQDVLEIQQLLYQYLLTNQPLALINSNSLYKPYQHFARETALEVPLTESQNHESTADE